MILFLLLLLIAIVLLLFRRQSKRQHREMLRATNPEYLAALDAAARDEARKKWMAIVWIFATLACLGLIGFCAQFQGFGPTIKPAKIESKP